MNIFDWIDNLHRQHPILMLVLFVLGAIWVILSVSGIGEAVAAHYRGRRKKGTNSEFVSEAYKQVGIVFYRNNGWLSRYLEKYSKELREWWR